MSNTTVSFSATGIGFLGLLTIAFIVLKLCGIISWKLIWVLSPLWIGFVLVSLFILFIAIIAYVVGKWSDD